MQRLGYSLEDASLHYNANQGLDLIFSNGSKYAVAEAKHGRYLSLLKTDKKGFRQGSLDYNIDRLQNYLQFGDGTHNTLVNRLLTEAYAGNLDSFATLFKSGRVFELPIGWPRIKGIKR